MTLNSSGVSGDSEDDCAVGYDNHFSMALNNGSPNEVSLASTVLDKMLVTPGSSRRSSYHLESKVDMVCGLLAMLGGQEHADMGETLLTLSTNPESCLAMRQSGCMPLLVQLMQSDKDGDTRIKAARAICNLISAQPDEKIRKREIRIYRLLEEMKNYTDDLQKNSGRHEESRHPLEALVHLMKLSFDEEHRQVICHFGGIHDLASLIEAEHIYHGGTPDVPSCNSLRKYACMTLTNVTFSDSGNKALLCSYRKFMRAIVVQLQSTSEELWQVSATILRNLAWHPDTTSRDMLREVGAVAGLVRAAMVTTEENTLMCILSALWNLSAHSAENKAEICAIAGALGFLVDMLSYKSSCNSFAIVENAGGVLRNISSQIAVRDDYREILRKHNCLQLLMEHLRSSNLTVVNNTCFIVRNLSAKCIIDQEALIKAGAADLLSSLTTSKHKMIALSASAALRNLLNYAQERASSRHGETSSISALIIHKHQDFIVNNIDASTICDESIFFENIYEYIPMSDLKRKFDTQKRLGAKRNISVDPTGKPIKPVCEDSELCQPFRNLHLSQSKTNFNKPKYLPPAPKSVTSSPSTYIPVRNKFSDCAFEDEIETAEQPIDYSRKYAEVKVNNPQSDKVAKTFSYGIGKSKSVKGVKTSGIYAETDLDQPTDYSLQYAEDDSDSDCDKVSKDGGGEFVQDTVKTYCTEGTPYETPFNFSTSTSMSDLRVDPNETRDKAIVEPNTVDSPSVKFKEDNVGTLQVKTGAEAIKSAYSSGLMSPEKPVNYCDEGTPGYFSRVSSFGSLTSIPPNDEIKEKSKSGEAVAPTPGISAIKGAVKTNGSPAEAKVVKFEQVLNYAEETPLMFSRSSSLASLDSIEQHSIHDDRSSIVSDFSRRTSGVISPSELPDSPTQMVPPSPKAHKASSFAVGRISEEKLLPPHHRAIPKSTIFEDKITKFKEESTPMQFSAATSLSSLTIDDHDEASQAATEQRVELGHLNEINENDIEEQRQNELDNQMREAEEVKHEVSHEFDDEFLGQDDEDDDEILAACIKMGMPSKKSQKQETSSSACDVRNNSTPSKSEVKECLSDDSSNLSEDDYKILAECIQAGMPKPKGTTSAMSNPSYEDKKNFPSVKLLKEKNAQAKNGHHLHSCSSYEISLNKRETSIRQQPIKSSFSDCSDDRIGNLTHRYQHRGPHKMELSYFKTSMPVSSSNTRLSSASCDNSHHMRRANVFKHAQFEVECALSGECIENGMSRERKATSSSPLMNNKSDRVLQKASPSRLHADYMPGRSEINRPRFAQKGNESFVGGNSHSYPLAGALPAQKISQLSTHRTAMSIPTANVALFSDKIPTHPISYDSSGCDSQISVASHVPLSIAGDPRLIHPAMERMQPSGFIKSKLERRHKEKGITKIKRLRNPQDLQKKVCLNFVGPCKDEIEKYAVENSPSYVSLRSSLSDLTVDGSVAGASSHLTSRVVSPHPEEAQTEDLKGGVVGFEEVADSSYPAETLGNAEQKVIEVVKPKQEEKKELVKSELLFSEEEDQNDDAILAACIQMGIRGKSLRGRPKPDLPKNLPDGSVARISLPSSPKSKHPDSKAAISEPLVGRLEPGASIKLSFRIKSKTPEETHVKEETRAEIQPTCSKLNIVEVSEPLSALNKEQNIENKPQNVVSADQCHNSLSRQESLSSLSIESVSVVETEQTVLGQPPEQPPPAAVVVGQGNSKPPQSACANNMAKSDKKNKSRGALVKKMSRVVDLLKLRKN